MRLNSFLTAVAITSALLAVASAPFSTTAHAATTDEIEICPDNFLKTVDENGAPLDSAVLDILSKTVLSECTQQPFRSTRIVGNVLANMHYSSTNDALYINAIANSLIRGNYSLACIYALEPIQTGATHWSDCGTLTKYNAISIITPTTIFCPLPSTRWHARASLFSLAGKELLRDDTWVVVP
jgi:hypothetical protein